MNPLLSCVMTPGILTVGAEDTIEKVDCMMASNKLSALPVTDANGGIFGIITTRDLLNFYAAKKNPKVLRAWEGCTHKIITTNSGTSLAAIAKLMKDNHILHVPITENGKLCGLVSASDYIGYCALCCGTEPCSIRTIASQ